LVFQMRVYFCIKIVLREKNIDFFCCYKEHDCWLGGNAKKYTVGYMSTMLEHFFLFSVNFESEKIIVKSESVKKAIVN